MNELQVFNFESSKVRTVVIDNEPWFVGKDVASALGYKDASHAVLDHVDEDDRVNSKTQGQNTPEFGQRGSWLINESGLYSLILSSKLPNARKFKRWVTSEVLPTIRKTGKYEIVQDSYMIEDPIERAKRWIEEQEEKKHLKLVNKQQEQIIKELKPKADYTDKILHSTELLTVRQIAMDYGMTPQEMNKLLRKLGVQYKQSCQWFLYKKYLTCGYTSSSTFVDKYGTPRISTKWTQKGRLFLYNLLKSHDVLPLIEQEIDMAA